MVFDGMKGLVGEDVFVRYRLLPLDKHHANVVDDLLGGLEPRVLEDSGDDGLDEGGLDARGPHALLRGIAVDAGRQAEAVAEPGEALVAGIRLDAVIRIA